jgi:hypothetical protein
VPCNRKKSRKEEGGADPISRTTNCSPTGSCSKA